MSVAAPGSRGKTPLASTGWTISTPAMPATASASRVAIALAWRAFSQPQLAVEQGDQLGRDEPHLRGELSELLAGELEALRELRAA